MDCMSRHGGNLRELARDAGRAPASLLDFSASVNPLGPPDCLRPTVSLALEQVVHYPDPESHELVAAIARHAAVPAEQIVVGNGSTEILFALARAMKRRRAAIPVPCYVDYATAAREAEMEIALLALDERDGFALDWSTLEKRLRGGEMVFLGQPNNPTGLAFDPEKFRAFAAEHPDTTFVVDEAFAEFVADCATLMRDVGENVVVLRSLTKFYAIPGLRLGFGVARAETAEAIRRRLPPWSVNSLAQAFGVAALADADYAQRTREYVRAQRESLTQALQEMPGLYVYPGAANFLLVRLNRADLDAPALARRLLQEGIAIRTFPRRAAPRRPLLPRRRSHRRGERAALRVAGESPGRRENVRPLPRRARPRLDVPGHQLQRGQEHPDRGALPDSAPGRRARRALQGAEHVAQLVRHRATAARWAARRSSRRRPAAWSRTCG